MQEILFGKAKRAIYLGEGLRVWKERTKVYCSFLRHSSADVDADPSRSTLCKSVYAETGFPALAESLANTKVFQSS